MKKSFLFLLAVLLASFIPSLAQARCAYYGPPINSYHCFGDKGGTGGKVFKEMDQNTKECGYWDPGCQKSSKQTRNYNHSKKRSRKHHSQ